MLVERTRRIFGNSCDGNYEIALGIALPVVAVYLNGARGIDVALAAPILKNEYVVHVPFRAAIIQHALDYFPGDHANRT